MNMGRLRCAGAIAAALTLLTLIACAGEEPSPVSTTTTTMASFDPASATGLSVARGNERAVQRIATARCERAFACRKIGAGKTWSSYEDCLRSVRDDSASQLIETSCARGIDPRALERCLDSARGESCELPIAAGGVLRCSSMALCY